MIGEKHLWGESRTVYRDKQVWVVELWGKAGGESSTHYHQHMHNHFFVVTGNLHVKEGSKLTTILPSGTSSMIRSAGVMHRLIFTKDTHAYETYYALPGHEIDEQDIIRLAEGKEPTAVVSA